MSEIDTPVAEQTPAADELIADPDAGYRWKHLIMSVLMIAGGFWFAYDGWIKWPADNRRIVEIQKVIDASKGDERDRLASELSKLKHHTDTDLLIQKVLAIVLPAFGLFWGSWTLKDTRGVLRLSGQTLYVPGHPPVGLSDIRRIDKRKWDRKGIAYLHYESASPAAQGVMKLDDFAYERKPTDEILERIEKSIGAGREADTISEQT